MEEKNESLLQKEIEYKKENPLNEWKRELDDKSIKRLSIFAIIGYIILMSLFVIPIIVNKSEIKKNIQKNIQDVEKERAKQNQLIDKIIENKSKIEKETAK